MNEQNTSMDEILSSIRDIVKEEANGTASASSVDETDIDALMSGAAANKAKPEPEPAPEPVADDSNVDIDALMAEGTPAPEPEAAPAVDSGEVDVDALMAEGAAPAAAEEEDVLELTEVVEADEAANPVTHQVEDDLVDINAFAETGAQEPAKEEDVTAARDEYSAEGDMAQPAAEPMAAAEEPVVDVATEQPAEPAEVAIEKPAVEETPEPVAPTPIPAPAAAPAPAAVSETPAAATEPVYLNAMPSAKGLQLAFPVEVLAEALRPLVKDWVGQNLHDIVERLVREELSRLVDKR